MTTFFRTPDFNKQNKHYPKVKQERNDEKQQHKFRKTDSTSTSTHDQRHAFGRNNPRELEGEWPAVDPAFVLRAQRPACVFSEPTWRASFVCEWEKQHQQKASSTHGATSRATRLDRTTRVGVHEMRHVQFPAEHDVQNVPEDVDGIETTIDTWTRMEKSGHLQNSSEMQPDCVLKSPVARTFNLDQVAVGAVEVRRGPGLAPKLSVSGARWNRPVTSHT